MNILNTVFNSVKINLKLLSIGYRKICSVIQQLRKRKATEERLLIIINGFNPKRSISNTLKNVFKEV